MASRASTTRTSAPGATLTDPLPGPLYALTDLLHLSPAALALLINGVLLTVLLLGRVRPYLAFLVTAGVFYLAGFTDRGTLLSSFANPALATLMLLVLVSMALERSILVGDLVDRLVRGSLRGATLRLGLMVAALSAFLNNTAVVSVLLAPLSRQKHHPASKLLIPLSYASILGGITTLVGTSTNLVVNSFVIDAGLPSLTMFQFTLVGLPVALLCLMTMVFTSRLLPTNASSETGARTAYFLEARIAADSPMIGRSIADNALRNLDGLYLVEINRGGAHLSPVSPSEVIGPDDVLIFTGETGKVQTLQRFPGLHVFGQGSDELLGAHLVEVVVSNESSLLNRTLRDVDFRTMFDAAVVGIRRGNRRLGGQLGRIPLRAGDCLLLSIGRDFFQHRNLERNFHVVSDSAITGKLSPRQSLLAMSGFAITIVAAAAGWLPLFDGLILLMGLFLAGGLLTVAEMRRRFPFELMLVIGSALSIAAALENSGGARLIAEGMQMVFGGSGAIGALVGIFLATVLLTELVTNTAAAAMIFPVALSTANGLGVDPMPFALVVAYGASAGFLMPAGYQTHLMVFSAGRYRTSDFVRAGLPVCLVYYAGVLTLIPWVYSL